MANTSPPSVSKHAQASRWWLKRAIWTVTQHSSHRCLCPASVQYIATTAERQKVMPAIARAVSRLIAWPAWRHRSRRTLRPSRSAARPFGAAGRSDTSLCRRRACPRRCAPTSGSEKTRMRSPQAGFVQRVCSSSTFPPWGWPFRGQVWARQGSPLSGGETTAPGVVFNVPGTFSVRPTRSTGEGQHFSSQVVLL